ncbi:MAG: class I SAM-dependent methyltransferase [Lachnospiraceae bacterium]|nr:class I SAM-dependent methyltransferase [Lachnospiraceae bacterium]
MQEAYSNFAACYDELMDNIPYDEWFAYLQSLLKENKIEDGIVAELGCGTGNITELMAQAGFDMIGIDNSDAMLDIANAKKAQNQSSSLYLLQDMREFELYGTVKAVISLCDSINYITDISDLLQVFKLVNNYLDPKGIFIFDFHPRYYYKEIVADATIAEDRDDISFIWDNFYDEDEDINELALSLFVKENTDGNKEAQLYRKYQELHLQRGYTLQEMKDLVTASGMELVATYDAFTHDEATEECERIYIIARECGK